MLLILFIILVVLVCGCDFLGDDSGRVINQSNLTDIKKETGITDEATLKKTGADPFMNCTAPDEFEYSTKRFCLIDPRTGKPLFYCRPNEEKNKVVAVVRKGGIYDSEEIGSQASEYYEAVRKDLGIGNAGLKKFEGTTIAELDEFASSLYVDDDIGYVLLIGDDLPVADVNETSIENLAAIYGKLECANRDCDSHSCRDMAISYILPPLKYTDEEKTDFVLKVLETYTGYHENFDAVIGQYERSILAIGDLELGLQPRGYDLPVVAIQNTEYERVVEEMKKKHVLLFLGVHGAPHVVGMGLAARGVPPGFAYPYYTSLEEYSDFTDEYGAPALFVDSGACQSMAINFGTVGPNPCCWPQAFMDSGVWVYYVIPMDVPLATDLTNNTIGLAIRKHVVSHDYIFGDILAHM
ncbi:MAG: hypothetical protein NTU61_06165, partial [Candidatus Altiarchaeota archaeon]|nr:hypothetical protein [Candidatus Altiarchaeota archaeon]